MSRPRALKYSLSKEVLLGDSGGGSPIRSQTYRTTNDGQTIAIPDEQATGSKLSMHYTISRDETLLGNPKEDRLRVLSSGTTEVVDSRERYRKRLIGHMDEIDDEDQLDIHVRRRRTEGKGKMEPGGFSFAPNSIARIDYEKQLRLLQQQQQAVQQIQQRSRGRVLSPKRVLDVRDAKDISSKPDTSTADSSWGPTDNIPDIRLPENDCDPGLSPTGFDNGEDVVEDIMQGLTLDPTIMALQRQIKALQEEAKRLRAQQEAIPSAKYEVFHCIARRGSDEEESEDKEERVYLGKPVWTVSGRYLQLKAHSPVLDPDSYIRYGRSLAFIIYKHYSAEGREGQAREALRQGLKLPEVEPTREAIQLISVEMREAFEAFTKLHQDFKQKFPGFRVKEDLSAPHLWWYHYRERRQALQHLPPSQADLMSTLIDWVDANYTSLYDRVDSQLDRGFISADTMPFLIRPGDVLVHTQEKSLQGAIATSWLWKSNAPKVDILDEIVGGGKPKRETGSLSASRKQNRNWTVEAWSYNYAGSFSRASTQLTMQLKVELASQEFPISKLAVVPLQFATEELRAKLRRRGETFWGCRHRKLVAYDNSAARDARYSPGQRFMVDYMTYKQIHSQSGAKFTGTSELSSAFMKQDEPPPEPEIYVFPDTIVGFDLRRKKWEDLQVDLIQEVEWNKQAFNHLVVDPETKELVQALVTNQLDAEKGTDLMHSKGNGLIMLLHGGPGTGKTFTAESVAEMAEKPLYPVTCGDIGTTPGDVEKYLEAVFHLGKTWGCVVLLDEAEVFLEQRSLRDLARNALVSVFLRALEYYDGILILTTNRVGTFDEAFKSRIQLSLHYEKLSRPRRKQIWRNFFSRLRTVNERNIDFDNIDGYIDELSEYEMNGRQIRNAITTARQWAQFQRRQMNSTHLTYVIKVIGKFDDYVKDVKEGFDDEEIAREERVR